MTLHRRQFLSLAAATATMPAASHLARAETYPTRPITLIVPFAAGAATDVTARIVADHMSHTLGQQIVIQNVGGAGGTVGATRGMRAEPDGYTILMGQMGTHAAAVALYPKLPYRPDQDFAPIGQTSSFPMLLVARKTLPPNDLQEFVAYLKANAATMTNAHAGVGSILFTTALLFNSIVGVKPTLVPFTGGGPAMNALIAGQVDYMCADPITVAPQVPANTVKVYAVSAQSRNVILPGVPTTIEAGLPAFQASAWNALFAPKATPKPVLDALTGALDKALDDDATRKRLFVLGSDIPDKAHRGPGPLAALVKSEIARWTPIIKAADVKM